jgi:integrase
LYSGLDPESKLFLNDRGNPYKLSPRTTGSGELQPNAMNRQLKNIIKKADMHGATPSSFRNSFIREMYRNGCGWNELKLITGIKQKRTLEK